ncbi:unnamed protein product [Prorocentrum cordatum]|uniref:Kinesin motor domain-containing protein n=1 Tax=Prorocentrum cordatum TaxID=2364126 RepID=A0ABN9X0Z9_9DINO|nr:unnamed protein product [Polarella glacialis]
MNTDSSRSHLVRASILCKNRLTSQSHQGKIIICDLAGSERLKKSESTGERQREAIEINKSLTALGDVIEALTKGHRVIPYRNHKLTQILQDSLGGSAKVLMFVNCSPASCNYEDRTLMSLKYATRAKNIINTYGGAGPRPQQHPAGLDAPPRRGGPECNAREKSVLSPRLSAR